MTTRGCREDDFVKIGGYLDRTIILAKEIMDNKGVKMEEYLRGFEEYKPQIQKLEGEVMVIPPD